MCSGLCSELVTSWWFCLIHTRSISLLLRHWIWSKNRKKWICLEKSVNLIDSQASCRAKVQTPSLHSHNLCGSNSSSAWVCPSVWVLFCAIANDKGNNNEHKYPSNHPSIHPSINLLLLLLNTSHIVLLI